MISLTIESPAYRSTITITFIFFAITRLIFSVTILSLELRCLITSLCSLLVSIPSLITQLFSSCRYLYSILSFLSLLSTDFLDIENFDLNFWFGYYGYHSIYKANVSLFTFMSTYLLFPVILSKRLLSFDFLLEKICLTTCCYW